MRKQFSFIYPVTEKRAGLQRIGSILYDHVADLVIKGVAYITKARVLNNIQDKYEFNIEEILLDGVNLYSKPDSLKSLDKLEKIKSACYNHIRSLFNGDESFHEGFETVPLNRSNTKLISMPLKRRV